MNLFRMLLRSILQKPVLALMVLWAGASISSAQTNNVFVNSVVMDAEQNVELYPGDPIRYTVTYGRSPASGGQTHQNQTVIVSVMLTTDGDPHNINNFVLASFGDVFPGGTAAGEIRTMIQVVRIPPNFTGTYFLMAKIHSTGGIETAPPGDGITADNFPSPEITSTTRVIIRSADSPTVSRISSDADGGDSNELSESPSVSADGRYVVFHSEATDLVTSPQAPVGISQIYLRDTVTGEVRMISQLGGVPGNAESKYPVISSTGVYDPLTGKNRLFIAYQSSATNLISGVGNNDGNGQTDIFLYDLGNGVTSLVSSSFKDSSAGRVRDEQGDRGSFLPSISDDGGKIAFESLAKTLLGKNSNGLYIDTNSRSDVYVFDRLTKVVTAASATSSGVLGSGDSTHARISGDGSTVVFKSNAGNLAGATALLPVYEIMAKTLAPGSSAGVVSRISVRREALGEILKRITPLNRESFDPAISKDGRFIAFATRASNIPAPNGDFNTTGYSQVYVVNRAVTVPSGTTLTPSLYDQTGNVSLSLVSQSVTPLSPEYGFGDDESLAPVISGDGRYVGFHTQASDLLPPVLLRSDGRAFQTNISGVLFVAEDNTGVTIETPVVTIEDTTGSGSGAEAYAVVADGVIQRIVVTSGGAGYSTADDAVQVLITGGGGGGAAATATVNDEGRVTGVTVTDAGFGFASASVEFVGGVASGATATAILDGAGGVRDVVVNDNGFGYLPSTTTIGFSQPDDLLLGWEPIAVPVIENGRVLDVVVFDPGWGYDAEPVVEVIATPIFQPTATVELAQNRIWSIAVTDPGAGYLTPPNVRVIVSQGGVTSQYPVDFNDPAQPQHTAFISDHLEFFSENAILSYIDSNGSADVYVKDTSVKSIVVTNGGSGYTDSFTIGAAEVQGGGGSGVSGWAVVENGAVSRIDLIDGGAGYLHESAISIVLPPPPSGGENATAKVILWDGAQRVSLSHYGEETVGVIINGTASAVPSSRSIAMSSDGRYMIMVSDSTISGGFIFGKSNRIPLDLNNKRDIFMVDRRIDAPVTPILGIAPTVTLEMETRTITFDSTRVISVTAFDGGDVNEVDGLPGDGVVKKIQVFANGILIAERDGSSSRLDLETTWTAPRSAGPAQIYAVAIDGNGNRIFSAPSLLTVVAPTSQRPAITLSSSSNTLTIGESVTLSASVSDPENQISYVQFYSNGLLLSTDLAPPYSYVFTPTTSGTYKLTAIVVDGLPAQVDENGEVTVVGLSNDALSNELNLTVLPPPAPTVQIVSPSGGVTVGSVGQPVFIEVTASTSNPNASVSNVTLRANGNALPGAAVRVGVTSSYRYTWTPASAGSVSITAVATDSQQGLGTSESRQFTILPAVANGPTVTITSPAAGAVLFTNQEQAGFRFSAADANGTVTSVVLYGNGARIGAAVRNPSSGLWELPVNVSLLSTGVYAFQALAQDNDGNIGSSTVISVQVATPLPVVTIAAPTTTGGFVDVKRGQPLPILINASTVDPLSRIVGVTVSVDGTSIGAAQRVGNTNEYALVWTPDVTGIFKILATATDSKGGSAQTAEVSVRVTEPVGVAPFVSVIFPDASPFPVTTLSELIASVVAVDSDGVINAIDIYVNDRRLGPADFVGENIYNRLLSFVGMAPGTYSVTALARDNDGNIAMSSPVLLQVQAAVGPTFTSVTLSATGAAIRGQVGNFSVSGVHPTGTIQSVYFLANGSPFANSEEAPNPVVTPPFSTSRVYNVAGTFKISALVVDSYGNTKVTNEILQVVVNNKAPTVRVTAPTPASSFILGNSVVLEAEAVALDPGDVIASVSFYANGQKLNADVDDEEGEDDGPVVTRVAGTNFWQFTWTPTEPGSYSIIAEAVTRGGTSESPFNYPISSVSSAVPVTIVSVAVVSDLYQKIVGRAATAGEVEAVVDLFGADVTSGEMADYLLKSDDFTNGNAELIFINLGVFGKYPTSSELASLRVQRALYQTDVEFVDALLATPTYTQLYGSVLNLTTTGTQQYNNIKTFALRSAANVGDSRSDATAFVQRFYNRIVNLALTPGQALVDYWNDGFRGLDVPGASTMISLMTAQSSALSRIRVAGAMLAFSSSRPESATIAQFNGYSLRQVANYYIAGGTGTVSTVSPILDWREAQFGSVLNTGTGADSADFDGDGVPNLLEYAFGTNPKASGHNPVVIGRSSNGQFLTLTFPRVANAGLVYRVEASSDLAAGFSSTGTSFTGNGTSAVYTDNVSLLTSGSRRFLRVVVSY